MPRTPDNQLPIGAKWKPLSRTLVYSETVAIHPRVKNVGVDIPEGDIDVTTKPYTENAQELGNFQLRSRIKFRAGSRAKAGEVLSSILDPLQSENTRDVFSVTAPKPEKTDDKQKKRPLIDRIRTRLGFDPKINFSVTAPDKTILYNLRTRNGTVTVSRARGPIKEEEGDKVSSFTASDGTVDVRFFKGDMNVQAGRDASILKDYYGNEYPYWNHFGEGHVLVTYSDGKLDVMNGKGTVVLEGNDGEQTVLSLTGDVKGTHLRGGKVKVTAGHNIDLEDVKEDIEAKLQTGQFHSKDTVGTLQVTANYGGIQVENARLRGRANHLTTGAGSIDVSVLNSTDELTVSLKQPKGLLALNGYLIENRSGSSDTHVKLATRAGDISVAYAGDRGF